MYEENPCKSISASLLLSNFDKFASTYGSDYPVVRNPEALVKGIDAVIQAMNAGKAPKNILLYILEDEADQADPYGARYILAITREEEGMTSLPSFAIRLFYNSTQEMESLSTVQPNEVVWSPDTLESSLHKTRTKYYLGFTYMLCDKSPGFDEELVPEEEMTLEEFLKYGIEGEIPAELIDISIEAEAEENGQIDTQHIIEVESQLDVNEFPQEEQPIVENTTEFIELDENDVSELEDEIASLFDDDFMHEAAAEQTNGEEETTNEFIPEEDDTEVIIISPEQYEEEYDDLETDYEELFE